MAKVKYCGLKRRCDIEWTNELRPDFAGFVFAGKKRKVTPALAGELRGLLDQAIPAVGVFVDEPIENVAALVKTGTIQLVQLHGHEDEAYIAALRKVVDVPLIKAFSIDTAADVGQAKQSSADYILVDHGKGGTGQAFDWSLLTALDRPYFLAGGLNPDNVKEALAYEPYALDVSSGIETDGFKDKEKMTAFMKAVRK